MKDAAQARLKEFVDARSWAASIDKAIAAFGGISQGQEQLAFVELARFFIGVLKTTLTPADRKYYWDLIGDDKIDELSEARVKAIDFVTTQGVHVLLLRQSDVAVGGAVDDAAALRETCLLYTSPSPRDRSLS
eukprot:7149868-Pyramimonas_sp.AAC.1